MFGDNINSPKNITTQPKSDNIPFIAFPDFILAIPLSANPVPICKTPTPSESINIFSGSSSGLNHVSFPRKLSSGMSIANHPPNSVPHINVDIPQNANTIIILPLFFTGFFSFTNRKHAIAIISPYPASPIIIPNIKK